MRRRQTKVEPEIDPKVYSGACLADEAKVITPNEFLMKVERRPNPVNVYFDPANPQVINFDPHNPVVQQKVITFYGNPRTLAETIVSAAYLAQGKNPEAEFAREDLEAAKNHLQSNLAMLVTKKIM